MKTPQEIIDLAYLRLEEAQILFNNGKYDGAFYLAGYSVELMLKAKICQHMGIPNLLDFSDKNVGKINNINILRNAVKIHDLYMLLILSGLKNRFDIDKASNINLARATSVVFDKWSEGVRYYPAGTTKKAKAKKILDLLSGSDGLLEWIKQS